MSICSKCRSLHFRKNQRYCNQCHANSMKKLRDDIKKINSIDQHCFKCQRPETKNNSKYCIKCKPTLTKQERFKNSVRRFTRLCVREGFIVKNPCEICGDKKSEAHHADYYQPLFIKWLCDAHHKEIHRI